MRIGRYACSSGVAHFVVIRNRLFTFTDNAALTCRASYDTVNRFFKFAHSDTAFITACTKDGCLVEQVGEVGTGEARCLFCQGIQGDVLIKRLVLGMYL